ncbi:FixH family protein [Bacteroidota bacterium]
MSWGWKILLVFTGFVLFILFLVFKSVQQDFYLVAEDYYKQEIEYQKVIDGMKNARSLGNKFDVNYDIRAQILHLNFPEDHAGNIAGEIYFFRPSNSKLDLRVSIRADQQGKMEIKTGSLKRGLWKLKILWTYKSNSYYFEKNQVI